MHLCTKRDQVKGVKFSTTDSIDRKIVMPSGVLIVLGNGHNLALGLKTSYSDFYSYYHKSLITLAKQSELVKFIVNKTICNQWCDYEQTIKQFAINTNVATLDIPKEMRCFEQLRNYLGFYMNGEALRRFNPVFVNAGNDFLGEALLDNPAIFLFDVIIQHDYRYKIVSFNYTDLSGIITELTKQLLSTVRENDNMIINQCPEYSRERCDIDYIHLTGTKCVFGTDDCESIPPALNFVKKTFQLDDSSYYNTYNNYKRIIFYGHSLGDTDHDFFSVLFHDIMQRPKDCNPDCFFITKDLNSKNEILTNLTKHIKSPLHEIQNHLNYQVIIEDQLVPSELKSRIVSALTPLK